MLEKHDVKNNNNENDISFDDSFDRIHTVTQNVKPPSVNIHFNELQIKVKGGKYERQQEKNLEQNFFWRKKKKPVHQSQTSKSYIQL